MIVTRLKLANIRAIDTAEFAFKPGFNLIVGVNGVGKSTVLDALAVCLAGISKQLNHLGGRLPAFSPDDIRASAEALTLECEVSLAGVAHSYVVHTPRATSVPRTKGAGLPREQTVDTPAKVGFVGPPPPTASRARIPRPLAVFFSTRRALPSDRTVTRGAASGGASTAFAEALSIRELRLGEFAAWMRAQRVLSEEKPGATRILSSFNEAVARFLPGYANLRATDESVPRLLIDRGGMTLAVRQLSDGERGALALVLDLTRRLAQANPGMEDPAGESEAIVLIDELDLHLHPRWQRQIVRNLQAAFPRSQFIATTHSPQVIGEVEHERIFVMGRGPVFSPTHSFGVDSSRVLEEIMDAPPRSPEVQDLLDKLSKSVADRNMEETTSLVATLSVKLGEDDAEVIRARTLLDFLGGEE